MNSLERFDAASGSSRDIALLRRECLEEDANGERGEGLANEVVGLLAAANTEPDAMQVLTVLQKLTNKDLTLFEEVSCSDDFSCRLDELAESQDSGEAVQTIVADLQKSMSNLETKDRQEPFDEKELVSRLPLVYGLSVADDGDEKRDDLSIMVHQVTSEVETDTHDVGNVMWPSSVMLARHITEHPSIVLDNKDGCLELGAGCGLVGLTAASLLKQERRNSVDESKTDDNGGDDDDEEEVTDIDNVDNDVIFTDYLPQVLENIERNLDLNDIDRCSVSGLDFFDQGGNDDSDYPASQPNWIDMEGAKRKQVGLVLAADVLCYSNDATNVANTINCALVEGGRAIVMSAANGRRFGVEEFPDAVRGAGLELEITNYVTDELSNDIEVAKDEELHTCAGYSDEYRFVMFDITKPCSE